MNLSLDKSAVDLLHQLVEGDQRSSAANSGWTVNQNGSTRCWKIRTSITTLKDLRKCHRCALWWYDLCLFMLYFTRSGIRTQDIIIIWWQIYVANTRFLNYKSLIFSDNYYFCFCKTCSSFLIYFSFSDKSSCF